MTKRVFISYAREDRETAAKLAAELEAQGFSTWWDWRLVGGANYRHAISEELKKADKAIVLWSSHSVQSDFVIDEASTAKSAGKLIPVSIDGAGPPLGFGGLHTLRLGEGSAPSAEIAAAVRDETAGASSAVALSTGLGPAASSTAGGRLYRAIEFHVSEYLRWLMAMAVQPDRVIRRTQSAGINDQYLIYMTRIVLFSVLIGATIGAVIPDRPPIVGRIQIFVILSLLWLFLSLLVHGVCRAFGGSEGVGTTVTLMMQSLAFAYVVSNFLALLAVYISRYYGPIVPGAIVNIKRDPGLLILALQFVLLLYLVPLTVSRAHGFSGARWVLVALCGAILTLLLGLPVAASGGC
jgi:hypothetical protein